MISDDKTFKNPQKSNGGICSNNSNNSNNNLLLEKHFPIDMEKHEDTKLTNWKSRIYKENLENMKSFTRKRLVTMEKLQDETNLNKDNKRITQQNIPRACANTSLGEMRDGRKRRKR